MLCIKNRHVLVGAIGKIKMSTYNMFTRHHAKQRLRMIALHATVGNWAVVRKIADHTVHLMEVAPSLEFDEGMARYLAMCMSCIKTYAHRKEKAAIEAVCTNAVARLHMGERCLGNRIKKGRGDIGSLEALPMDVLNRIMA